MRLLDVVEVGVIHFGIIAWGGVVAITLGLRGVFIVNKDQVTCALVLGGLLILNFASLADACLSDGVSSFDVDGIFLTNSGRNTR